MMELFLYTVLILFLVSIMLCLISDFLGELFYKVTGFLYHLLIKEQVKEIQKNNLNLTSNISKTKRYMKK